MLKSEKDETNHRMKGFARPARRGAISIKSVKMRFRVTIGAVILAHLSAVANKHST